MLMNFHFTFFWRGDALDESEKTQREQHPIYSSHVLSDESSSSACSHSRLSFVHSLNIFSRSRSVQTSFIAQVGLLTSYAKRPIVEVRMMLFQSVSLSGKVLIPQTIILWKNTWLNSWRTNAELLRLKRCRGIFNFGSFLPEDAFKSDRSRPELSKEYLLH